MRRHVVLGAVVVVSGMGLAGCSSPPVGEEAAGPSTVTTSVVTSRVVQTVPIPTTVPITVTVPTTSTATKTEISTASVTVTVTEVGQQEPGEPTPAPRRLVPEVPEPADPTPEVSPSGPFSNCTEAREAGAAPVYRGQPGYSSKLDRDGDGVGCE